MASAHKEGNCATTSVVHETKNIDLCGINPFLIEPVLSVLFQGLAVTELKVCRLVCLKWNEIAREFLSHKSRVLIGTVEMKPNLPEIFPEGVDMGQLWVGTGPFPDSSLKDAEFKNLILTRDTMVAMKFRNMTLTPERVVKLGAEILRIPEIKNTLQILTLQINIREFDWLKNMLQQVHNLKSLWVNLFTCREAATLCPFPIEEKESNAFPILTNLTSFTLESSYGSIDDRDKSWPFLFHVLQNSPALRALTVGVSQLYRVHPKLLQDISIHYSGQGLELFLIADASNGQPYEKSTDFLTFLKIFLQSTATTCLKHLYVGSWSLHIQEWRKAFECMREKQELVKSLNLIVRVNWSPNHYNVQVNSEGYKTFSSNPDNPNALDLFALFPSNSGFKALRKISFQYQCSILGEETDPRYANLDTREKSSRWDTKHIITLDSQKCFPSVQELWLGVEVIIGERENWFGNHYGSVIPNYFRNFNYNFPNLREFTMDFLHHSTLSSILSQLPSCLESFKVLYGDHVILKDDDFVRNQVSLLPKNLQIFAIKGISFNFTNDMVFHGLLQLAKLRIVHLGSAPWNQLKITEDARQALDTRLQYFICRSLSSGKLKLGRHQNVQWNMR